jgi:hypothetical protein
MTIGGILGITWPYLKLNFLPLLPGFVICMITIFGISVLTNRLAKKENKISQNISI